MLGWAAFAIREPWKPKDFERGIEGNPKIAYKMLH